MILKTVASFELDELEEDEREEDDAHVVSFDLDDPHNGLSQDGISNISFEPEDSHASFDLEDAHVSLEEWDLLCSSDEEDFQSVSEDGFNVGRSIVIGEGAA